MKFAKCFQTVCMLFALVSLFYVLYELVLDNIETIKVVIVFCSNILNLMVVNILVQNECHEEIKKLILKEEK